MVRGMLHQVGRPRYICSHTVSGSKPHFFLNLAIVPKPPTHLFPGCGPRQQQQRQVEPGAPQLADVGRVGRPRRLAARRVRAAPHVQQGAKPPPPTAPGGPLRAFFFLRGAAVLASGIMVRDFYCYAWRSRQLIIQKILSQIS